MSRTEPDLLRPVDSFVLEGLSCTLMEIIEMLSFPGGRGIETWNKDPDADKFADEWDEVYIRRLYVEAQQE